MLNLSYTLIIGSALLLLISGIALGQWDSGIRQCERVKNQSYERFSAAATSKSSSVFYICCTCLVIDLLACNRLKVWFNPYVVAYLARESTCTCSCHVAYFSKADRRVTTS